MKHYKQIAICIKIIILMTIVFTGQNLYSQQLNVQYYIISNDTLHQDHYLTFKCDSVVELTNVPRHMNQRVKLKLPYIKNNNDLTIICSKKNNDSTLIQEFGFENGKELTVRGRALISADSAEVYIIRNDFKKNPDMIAIFDSQEYRVDMGESNSYGLIEKTPKGNIRLKRKMKSIKNSEGYEIKVVKGFEAYKKYGYDYAFGVLEIRKK